jgi:NAD(P)-dependent dehydrogenase (short-subunit alcohol dehydrogenase family)
MEIKMRDLGGKVAVVTGGGSGIGRALSLALASKGAKVAVCDLNLASAEETVRRVVAAGGSASSHQVDVRSEEEMRILVERVLDEHAVVDVVVNNAGISTAPAPTVDTSLEIFRSVIEVNLWGVIHGSVLFLPHLVKRPAANLVNVASFAGLMGISRMSPYSASKFGVRGLTEALRMEFAATPLKVTLACPGGTRTSIMANSPVIDEAKRDVLQRNLSRSSNSKSPEYVAAAIVKGIIADKPRVLIGPDTKVIDTLVRALPGAYTKLLRRGTEKMFEKALG